MSKYTRVLSLKKNFDSGYCHMLMNNYYGNSVSDLANRDFRFNVTSYAPQTVVPIHEHTNAYICIASTGGFLEYSGQTECEVRTHDLVYHPPGHQHADQFLASGGSCVNLELGDDWLARLLPLGHAVDPVYASDPELRRLARALLRELNQADTVMPLTMDELLLDLFTRLRGPARRRWNQPPGWLLAVRDRVRTCCTEPYRLAPLAEEAGVHPVHLAREFRRQFGCTVGAYQRRARVETAQALLASTHASLLDIALDVGFSSQSHFSRVFTQVTGMSPKTYQLAVTAQVGRARPKR